MAWRAHAQPSSIQNGVSPRMPALLAGSPGSLHGDSSLL